VDPRKLIVKPRPAATMPPMSIQTALSVGEPVKNLETSDEKELVALTPITIRMMPPTRRASARILFINGNSSFVKLVARELQSLELPPGNEANQDHDDGDDEEEMNKPADGIGGHHPEEPKNEQYDCNGC
jgi:hypothetical protein